jgi:hypothetical protein
VISYDETAGMNLMEFMTVIAYDKKSKSSSKDEIETVIN